MFVPTAILSIQASRKSSIPAVASIALKSVLAPKSPVNKGHCPLRKKASQAKRRGAFVFLSLLVACGVLAGDANPHADSVPETFCNLGDMASRPLENLRVVARVVDGDTLQLTDGAKVRLIGVNTPEMGSGDTPPEPYALAARQSVEKFLAGDSTIYLLVGSVPRDHYHRLLGHVFNRRGESLEAQLLSMGLGWHIAIPPNLEFAECLAEAEQFARRRGRGLWSSPPQPVAELASGGFQFLRGRVQNVTFSKVWRLELEGGLWVVIEPRNWPYFDRHGLEQLRGQEVELRGWVYPRKGSSSHSWELRVHSRWAVQRVK